MSSAAGEDPSVIMLIMLCSEFFLLFLFIVFGIFAMLLFYREYPKQQEHLAGFSLMVKRAYAKKRQKEITRKSAELSPRSKAFLENEKKNQDEVEVDITDEPKKRNKGLFDSQTERSELSTEMSEMVKPRTSIIQINEQFSSTNDASVMGRTAKETGNSFMARAEKTCKETGISLIGRAEKTCKETGRSMIGNFPANSSILERSDITGRGLDKSVMGRTAKGLGKSTRSIARTAQNNREPAEKTCREKDKSKIEKL